MTLQSPKVYLYFFILKNLRCFKSMFRPPGDITSNCPFSPCLYCKRVFAVTCPFSDVHVSSDVSGEICFLSESFFHFCFLWGIKNRYPKNLMTLQSPKVCLYFSIKKLQSFKSMFCPPEDITQITLIAVT